jgi:hypothetical protein
MKPSLRQTLFDSHISAVTIAVLLVWSLGDFLEAVWPPAVSAISFLLTAIAIRGLPFVPPRFTISEREMILVSCDALFRASTNIVAAWILSHWVYGMGPLQSLKNCRERLTRRN